MKLSILYSLSALAQSAHVVAPIDQIWDQPEPVVQEQAPVAWLATESALEITPGAEQVGVEIRVLIHPLRPAWVSLPVLDGRVFLREHNLPLHQGPDGNWWFTGFLQADQEIRVQGTLPGQGSAGGLSQLYVAQAPRQQVHVRGEQLDAWVDGQPQGTIAPRSKVTLRWEPAREQVVEHRRVVRAEVQSAAWLEEGAIRQRSRVRWELRQGSLSTLHLRLPPGASEVMLSGSAVARWEQSGQTLTIEPLAEVEGAFEVQVEWRQTFSGKQATVQHPEPTESGGTTYSLTLAGDSETLLQPSAQGMRTVALEQLPPKARSLGDAAPAAAWTGAGSLQLQALRLSSLDGPELVVDLARCTAAQSVEGRTLMRCSLDVRNASRQFLGVSLPPGFELWAARVNGDGVAPVRWEDGRMGVPLERSVETLAGLTAIQVELTFLAKEAEWGHKGERELTLPAYDAPVARLEWVARLPPGYRGKIEGGSARVAAESSTELVYATTTSSQELAARETWNLALEAYQDNDFDKAQSYVDQTLSLDADNANAQRLQTNLDVLSGDVGGRDATGSEADEAMSRRVKEMAKAKVADEEVEQEESLKEAERLMNEGRYEEAIETYEQVQRMSDELARYEHAESKKQDYYRGSSSSGLAEARKRAKSRDAVLDYKEAPAEQAQTESLMLDRVAGVVDSADATYAWDEGQIEGELLSPEDVFIVDEDDFEVPEEPSVVYSEERLDVPAAEPVELESVVVGSVSVTTTNALGGGAYGAAAPAQPARPRADRSSAPPPPAPPPPAGNAAPAVPSLRNQPDLAATTLAIPVPEHGQPLVVTQRLLEPGQSPTLTLRYRETK
ncbi:MAG: tetratricopeptide repeat protein [Myxococcota bacterium]|nr:tetratricopeptide repeat protein [Myxococcota bacterium]